MEAPDMSSDCSVIVAVRVRPLNSRETGMGGATCITVNSEFCNMVVKGVGNRQPHTFTYDHTWNSIDTESDDFASQETVYNDVGKKVLAAAFQGYNACIFAYGQTGSGKTFAMMGVPEDDELKGVIPRLSQAVFDKTQANDPLPDGVTSVTYTIEASYLEIYQERVKCLLNPRKENLKVREHPVTGPYVEDLTKLVVTQYDEVLRLIEDGSSVRMVASTKMNDTSSRSHAIFTLVLTQTKVMLDQAGKPVAHDTVSKINLVDLAGSERAKSTGATGTRLAEGAQINKSLSALGLVISGLAETSKRGKAMPHIPYRDSTLTWLLKDNLGGNSKTFMISTVSPAMVNHDETLSTLRYADRAKSIVTKARVNEDPNTKLIRQLREELAKYKQKLVEYEDKFSPASTPRDAHHREGLPPVPLQAKSSSYSIPLSARKHSIDTLSISPTSLATPRGDDGMMQTPRVPKTRQEALMMREKLQTMEKLMVDACMSKEEKEALSKESEEARQQVMEEMGIKTLHADGKQPHFVNMVLDGGWLVQYVTPGDELIMGASDECGMKLVEGGSQAMHAVVRCTEEGVTTIAALPDCDVELHHHHTEDDTPPITHLTNDNEPVILTHGTRIDIGENMFRYIDPNVSEKEKAQRKRMQINQMKSFIDVREAKDLKGINESSQQHVDPVVNEEELRRQVREEILAEQQVKNEANLSTPRPPSAPATPELRVAIPILKLHEVAGQSSSLLPGRGPGSARRNSFLKAKDSLPSKPLTSRFPNEPMVQIFKQSIVFVGPEGGGKTSLKKCLGKDPSFWERKDLPTVTPTLGVEHSEMKATVKGSQVILLLEDLSGNLAYNTTFAHSVPDQRCVVVLTYNLAEEYSQDELLFWLDNAMLQSPSPIVILVGTHRDELKDTDGVVIKKLSVAERAVVSRMKETYRLHKASGSNHPAPQMLGAYAVSCKTRTVMNLTKTYKFKEILRVISEAAYDRCIGDPFFPEANVPSSILTLARQVVELRSAGTWMVPGSQFKTTAANAAPKYQIDVRELARVMSLLHSWRVLLHFSNHPVLRKQVFTDPLWMFGVLNTINMCAHYQAALNPKDIDNEQNERPSSHAERLLRVFSGPASAAGENTTLPFSPAEVFNQDQTNSFFRGILTVPLAVCLFRSHLARINCGPREVTRCLRLLVSFDFAYPVIPPSAGESFVPTTPLPSDNAAASIQESGDADTNLTAISPQNAPVCFIPSLFSSATPTCLHKTLPLFLVGMHRKIVFSPVLPPTLFARLLTRVARCVRRLYVGKMDYLTQDPYSNNFWKHGAWVQDTNTTRAVLWSEPTTQTIQFVTNVCNSRLQCNNALHMSMSGSGLNVPPSFQLAEGILKATRSLAAEHPGCIAEEYIPCHTAKCRGWVLCREERHLKEKCAVCSKEYSVLETDGALREGNEEDREDALFKMTDELKMAGAKVEMGAVEEPTEDEIEKSVAFISECLPKMTRDFSDIDCLKEAVDKVVDLRNKGKEADASELEAAMKVLTIRDKLVRSTTALDEIVEGLTAVDALDVTLVR